MKTLHSVLTGLLPLVLVASLSSQEATKSGCCGGSAETAVANTQCDVGPVAVFQKLNAEDKKATAAALARLTKNCPYGSRLNQTVTLLDKLYADASASLVKVAKHENCDPALAKDLMAEVKAIEGLRAINAANIKTTRAILASNSKPATAGGGCCGDTANAKPAKAEGGCCGDTEKASTEVVTAEKPSGCCGGGGGCGDSAPKLTGIYADSKNMVASWSAAGKDLAKLDPKMRDQLSADMKLLTAKGLTIPQQVMASIKAQSDQIKKVHAGLSCSTSGLVGKHSKALADSSYTSKACDESGKALASASALLKASSTALNAPADSKAAPKAKSGCCGGDEKAEIGQ